MRIGTRGVLTVTLTMASVLTIGPAAQAGRHDPIPTQAQVDEARASTASKTQDVAALRARLVVANARLQAAAERAEVAAENYNGAIWRLGEARQRTADARAAAVAALAHVEQQRAGIAQLVTQSYPDRALDTVSAIVDADGPAGVMSRLGVVQSAGTSMQARFDDYTALNALARVAQAKAERAEREQAALVAEAAKLRDEAAQAERAAQGESDRIARERRHVIAQLARAEKVSVALATARQEGLERKAARAAAAAQAAAQAAKAKQAVRKQEPTRTDPKPTTSVPSPAPSGSAGGTSAGESGSSASAGEVAVEFAMAQLGETYRWGAAGPDAWDCSGLTMMAWRQAGVDLPHYSAAQYAEVEHISAGDLRPGDLVFWGSSPGSIHHVALYIGNGRIVHAPRTGRPVSVDSMYYWVPPNYFGRP